MGTKSRKECSKYHFSNILFCSNKVPGTTTPLSVCLKEGHSISYSASKSLRASARSQNYSREGTELLGRESLSDPRHPSLLFSGTPLPSRPLSGKPGGSVLRWHKLQSQLLDLNSMSGLLPMPKFKAQLTSSVHPLPTPVAYHSPCLNSSWTHKSYTYTLYTFIHYTSSL